MQQQQQMQEYLPLAAAARLLPSGNNGKPIHVSTLHRWLNGIQGIRLEGKKIGGRWYVRLEDVERFVGELTAASERSSRTGNARNQKQQQAHARRAVDRKLRQPGPQRRLDIDQRLDEEGL